MSYKKLWSKLGLACAILIISLVIVAIELGTSKLISNGGKLNIAFWGDTTYIISLGTNNNQHNLLILPNSSYTRVTGGLHEYKYGSLGRLATLEKNPQLIEKTLSISSGILLDATLYHPELPLYTSEPADKANFDKHKNILIGRVFSHESTLNYLDKLYIYYFVSTMRKSNTNTFVDKFGPTAVTYDIALRSEKKLVQLLYNSDAKTAYALASTLESTGIRVPDLTQLQAPNTTNCLVQERESPHSKTARFLANYFNCKIEISSTGLYEVVMTLDTKTENEWKIQ